MKKYTTATLWGRSLNPPILANRVGVLCRSKRVKGAKRVGGEGPSGIWMIPDDAKDPRLPSGRPKNK